jgi:DNA-binding cell septation regulator SpoVG
MHMQITSIRIEPNPLPESKVTATVEVVLNGSLSLRGIRILRGRYGLFLAFPGLQAGAPYRAFDTISMRFR